jgi:hypothetical protein
MTQQRWMSHLKLTALSAALGLAVFVSAQGVAIAADDDYEKDSIWNLDRRIFENIMRGIGLRSGYDEEIDYRERSPLVVPPSRNLPKPQTGSGLNAAWPVDPDVKRRAEMAAKRKREAAYSYDWEKDAASLSPSELAKGRSATNGRANTDDKEPRSPSDLGYVGGLWNFFAPKGEEVGTFTSEPPRTSLTSPPTGYMTPSPAQPYGLSKPRYEKAKPVDRALGELN